VTVLEILKNTANYLAQKGIESPRLNIEYLLADALGMRRIDLYLEFDRTLSEEVLAPLREKVRRRAAGEPLQYLIGSWDFFGRPFRIDRRALIPRPETEILVEFALKAIRKRASPANRLIDVGTGSGVLAITFALECPDLEIVASDISMAALDLARENAEKQQVAGRIQWLESDLLDSVPDQFDFLVANLPYIPSAELSGLAREVQHDPPLALDGGADGLAIVRRLVQQAPKVLARDAFLILELGLGQAAPVTELLGEQKFRDISVKNDYQGVQRFVTAWYG
jgi:release factor glutamine methyltransferase